MENCHTDDDGLQAHFSTVLMFDHVSSSGRKPLQSQKDRECRWTPTQGEIDPLMEWGMGGDFKNGHIVLV